MCEICLLLYTTLTDSLVYGFDSNFPLLVVTLPVEDYSLSRFLRRCDRILNKSLYGQLSLYVTKISRNTNHEPSAWLISQNKDFQPFINDLYTKKYNAFISH